MPLHDRIREARKNKGLTQEELGELIGVAKTTIAGYEKNREPSAAKLGEIADTLDVDVNFLLQDEMKKSPAPADTETGDLDKEEQTLIHNYRQLNDEGQEKLRDYADDLVFSSRYTKNNQPEISKEA